MIEFGILFSFFFLFISSYVSVYRRARTGPLRICATFQKYSGGLTTAWMFVKPTMEHTPFESVWLLREATLGDVQVAKNNTILIFNIRNVI